MALVGVRWVLVVIGRSWWLVLVNDGSWCLFVVVGGSLWLLMFFSSFFVALCGSMWF